MAGEVKELATESSAVSNKVAGMIEQIKTAVTQISADINDSTGMVDGGIFAVQDVNATLEDIRVGIEEVTYQAKEVAGLLGSATFNADVMLAAIENIAVVANNSVTSTQQMTLITQDQVANMNKINTDAALLENTAEDLHKLVTNFKLR